MWPGEQEPWHLSGWGGFLIGVGRAGGVRVKGAVTPVLLREPKSVILKGSLCCCSCLGHLSGDSPKPAALRTRCEAVPDLRSAYALGHTQ